jgi:chromosome segregation ATPase
VKRLRTLQPELFTASSHIETFYQHDKLIVESNMQKKEEKDQFEVLEAKVDSLIRFAGSLKKEKESLLEKLSIQEEKIADLSSEVESLRAARDNAKQRVVFLLEKLDQINITS